MSHLLSHLLSHLIRALIVSPVSVLVLILALSGGMLQVSAQSADPVERPTWTVVRECLPDAQPRPSDFGFPGFIASYVPGDGIRALRAGTFTTYYLAFAGSNFIESAAFSPDGRWMALPYGFIETAAAFDVRYRVGELRVMSTGTYPQISARVPWQASFQQGALEPVYWLDDEHLVYVSGSFLNGQTPQQVQPFSAEVSRFALGVYDTLAPDHSRGFQADADRLALIDLSQRTSGGAVLAHLPSQHANLSGFVWSPDSAQFAALEFDHGAERWLSLIARDGTLLVRLLDVTSDRLLTNFRWSPDSTQFAFTVYNPYDDESLLYTGDMETQTIIERCVLLNTLYTRAPEQALAWSPDSTQLALALTDGLHIYDTVTDTLYRIGDDIGGLIDWKRGE